MNSQIIRVGDFANLYIKDGILHGIYLPNAVIDLEKAKIFVAAKMALCKTDYPFLVDGRYLKSITAEAKTYFSNSEEGNAYIIAAAFLVESNLTRLMGNLYLTLNTPRMPNKLFTDKKEALMWLSNFKAH